MTQEQWISVAESLPKKGERVKCKLPEKLTPHKCGYRILYRMKHNGKWNDYHDHVTHWVPNSPTDYNEYLQILTHNQES